MNKEYFWQKTEKCTQCVFNDNPDSCHWYGYLFWKELPLADDCWDFLTPEQWKLLHDPSYTLKSGRGKDFHTLFREFSHANHPGMPAGYLPPYYPKDPFAMPGEMYTW